ncbi:hypothetical protein [Mycobacterium sp.]|uniref:hypothetical protein n=1 Tax=Mycobacterium sp. TaxID=1785 RepID=UPI002C71EC8B|nr:hypothetical protein [Mycobacterium sp.]HTY35406.1 hypothetical protein [Mycobacterium sp.]
MPAAVITTSQALDLMRLVRAAIEAAEAHVRAIYTDRPHDEWLPLLDAQTAAYDAVSGAVMALAGVTR